MTERIAIVTGSARGIGAATARRLAEDGMAVAVLDLDEAACAGTVKEITDDGGHALAVAADVSDLSQVQAAVERVAQELGEPTVLVNNAGVIRDNMLYKMTDEDWDTVMNVHLRGAFHMTRAVQKYMVQLQYGRIVNLSSSSALGNRGQLNYSTAKRRLAGFHQDRGHRARPVRHHRQRGGAWLYRHRHDRDHRGPHGHLVRGLPECGRGAHTRAPGRASQ